MTSWGIMNHLSGYCRLSATPAERPRCKSPSWRLSMAGGAAACADHTLPKALLPTLTLLPLLEAHARPQNLDGSDATAWHVSHHHHSFPGSEGITAAASLGSAALLSCSAAKLLVQYLHSDCKCIMLTQFKIISQRVRKGLKKSRVTIQSLH